ncbi:hypothetical protein NC653_029628 [Populus alba x Populus x berolinensis]|uniref:F-box domain-containing protein n=1 Tax=Populus alba x Populus x berolinensis TaxID=444605 RepID=A0AAD6M2M3_9ROSI|nr:hypothetical protein NC653_029628 [Populus alba x Populus x berolinensis]
MATQLSGKRVSGFSLVDEETVQNILSRLPALTFAYAACVNKRWYKICSQILKRPKLASALSLNPSLHDAVKEVIEQVLSEPIRPHFAIACISREFNLELAHGLIIEKLGSRIPIITNVSSGIIGVDGIANELFEEKWETTSGPNIQESDTAERGLVLLVGFLPGLKIGTIPLLQPRQGSNTLVDKFVMDILHYTAAVSDCAAPAGIIMFGDKTTDMKPIVAKMDCAMPEETVIVGDASADFIFRTGDDSLNQLVYTCCFQAVALVFARDRYKPEGLGEIQFHVTKSTGVLPFGPKLKAVCVVPNDSESSCVFARLEGQNGIMAAGAILNEIKQLFREEDTFADLYIGVTKETQRTSDSGIFTPGESLDFYKVIGGGEYYFTVNGFGIRTGDSFLFYQSDSATASSSCDHAFNKLLALKAELKSKNYLRLSNLADKDDKEEVLGGFIFSCYHRGESFFGDTFVDSYPFCNNFPTAPVAGLFCRGEIGRGPKSLMNEEYDDETSPRCCVHVYSTIYLPQLENSENTTMEEKPKEPKMTMTSFASINEDLVQNIIKRLPASSFASAACVSKSWNQICNQILSKPKFASAFSLNPNEKVALEEVVNKVLSEPIRPHFAIANVIGSGVDLREKLDFLATKLGSQTPIIVSCASGIMGRDVVTGEHREVMLEEYWADGESNSCFGIILTVGFLPGLKVDVIPLLQPRKVHRLALVDDFVMNIRHYATSVSGWASPVGIILFGDEGADQKPVMEKLREFSQLRKLSFFLVFRDHAMSRDTVIVGDERAQFLYRSGVESRNDYGSSEYFPAAVALVFARDRDKPCGTGEIQFHAALSSGVSAIGPRYKAVSVRNIGSETGRTTLLTARREGEQEIQDGQRILDDINNELVNQIGRPDLYIGVTKQRKCFVGSEKSRVMTFLVFHGVMG